jgi:hypothetical protein
MAPRKARNTNRQGANFELQIMEHLKERGYDALRSSGSKGPVDVVAVGDFHTLWIQAKMTNPILPPAERSEVRRVAGRVQCGTEIIHNCNPAIPLVAYRINGDVMFRELTGSNAGAWIPFRPKVHSTSPCGRCGHVYAMHSFDTGCWEKDATCGCAEFIFPSVLKKQERNERDRAARAEARRMVEETP